MTSLFQLTDNLLYPDSDGKPIAENTIAATPIKLDETPSGFVRLMSERVGLKW